MTSRRALYDNAGTPSEVPAADAVTTGTPVNNSDAVPKSFIRYDLPFFCAGKPAVSEVIGQFVSPAAFTLPANLAGSIATALTAASASAAWSLNRIPAGSTAATQIGTVTFAAGSRNGAFAAASATAIAVGDILTLTAPGTQDTALADIGFTFVGVR